MQTPTYRARRIFLSLWARTIRRVSFDVRGEEYRHALKFFEDCDHILDVACGTGTFMSAWPGRSAGIDINPENVAHCRALGLDAKTGSALELPYENDTFGGLHCSHLMQVFSPDQAATFMREAGRVVRDNGVIVITTLNWFPRFFRHPENLRPYPPDALLRYNLQQAGATSPMYHSMPRFEQEGIWFRRPALVELLSVRSRVVNSYFAQLNTLQIKLGLRKFWAYDAYTIKLRVRKTTTL